MFRVQLVGQLEITSLKLSGELPAELRLLFIHGHQLESSILCFIWSVLLTRLDIKLYVQTCQISLISCTVSVPTFIIILK